MGKNGEHFQYLTLGQQYQTTGNKYQVVDPGFGNQMSQLEQAPEFDPSMLNDLETNPGGFGQLVSYLENRRMAPSIKNLSV